MFNTSIFDNGGSGSSEPSQDFLNVPQPIDITHQRQPSIFNNSRFRRESIAHSQGMGGVSWGSVTIGSWLKDEVMMYQNHPGGSNNANGANLPGNLINPRRGSFRMSSVSQPVNAASLHAGTLSPPNTTSYLTTLEADYCKDYSCCGQLLPTLHDLLRHYEEAHISASPQQEADSHLLAAHRQRNNLNNIHNVMETVSTTDVFLNNHHHQQQHQQQQQQQQGSLHLPASHFNLQNQTIAQGSVSGSISHAGTGNGAPHHNNSNQHQQRHLPPHKVNPQVADADSDSMYIDDPARHLYVMENEEYKPFKCPVIGCEKTYKNQNGLKYHRLHGHQNQTLKENEDGTFSIIDPESNTPYLDGAGMEKDKPYRCEVCGKRYKNLNGLKYHRGHTTH
ncbi:Transcriptional regulator of ribosomal biogenesis proteins [Candidozyma auris]|uniref:C2H2-type domain-containing protein n=2 Tax=Candidozyma auris TaxID=498019 RepID=A0A2H0ZJ16_CANAR|nr:zinc-coordinating transcription factor SFP1 [[Candida] auris]KND98542.2 hypothetical protein QG37_04437 [[Candida] auris]PIS50615.1 hypothetical protein B9J08_004443 [[Candida] auris]PIS50967.1 hypothetical protein CJI97_004507 [[Candida] auris]PSK79728.1 hypothetical protein CJJ07_000351 [[Candida] auris]QEL62791.1 hypothetical protein CJJ09_004972 [[Candida] auris]